MPDKQVKMQHCMLQIQVSSNSKSQVLGKQVNKQHAADAGVQQQQKPKVPEKQVNMQHAAESAVQEDSKFATTSKISLKCNTSKLPKSFGSPSQIQTSPIKCSTLSNCIIPFLHYLLCFPNFDLQTKVNSFNILRKLYHYPIRNYNSLLPR